MKLLVVNTLSEQNEAARAAIRELKGMVSDCKVIHTYEMQLKPCVGCNACWLKTPGVCSIQDGYEEILKGYIEYDATVFLAGTALNFVDYRMKNVIDRILPLVTMYIHIVDGQCRHVPRYDRKYQFGLLYFGIADGDYLNQWMDRVALNMGGSSLGAFPIHQAKEVLSCIL
ncbi:MAG: flavodoxin family protein [Lachnospiraceae bacterium]|nr:flavodoxin family protein [Lachnospiraceae bacterium]